MITPARLLQGPLPVLPKAIPYRIRELTQCCPELGHGHWSTVRRETVACRTEPLQRVGTQPVHPPGHRPSRRQRAAVPDGFRRYIDHPRHSCDLGQPDFQHLDILIAGFLQPDTAGLVKLLCQLIQFHGQPGPGGAFPSDDIGQVFPQRIDPSPGHGAGGEQRHVLQPVGVEQLSQVSQTVVQIGSAYPIHLVQHNHHHLAVPGKRLQIAVMHRRIRVFLRIQHPDELINNRHHPVHLGSVCGHHGIVIW